MLKSVAFLSKAAFDEHLKANDRTIAISILGADEGKAWLNRGFAGSIRLCFDDLYEELMHFKPGDLPDLHPRHEAGARLMFLNHEFCDYNDASRICGFINHYAVKDDMFDLVVHCQAGISRSAAVAQFAADRYGVPIVSSNDNTSAANKRLLRLLNKVIDEVPASVFEPPKIIPASREREFVTVSGIF